MCIKTYYVDRNSSHPPPLFFSPCFFQTPWHRDTLLNADPCSGFNKKKSLKKKDETNCESVFVQLPVNKTEKKQGEKKKKITCCTETDWIFGPGRASRFMIHGLACGCNWPARIYRRMRWDGWVGMVSNFFFLSPFSFRLSFFLPSTSP